MVFVVLGGKHRSSIVGGFYVDLGLVGGIEGVEIIVLWWFVGLLVVLFVKEGYGFFVGLFQNGGEFEWRVPSFGESCKKFM